MTRTTNSRIAGFTYLFYIAVAFPSMVLFDRATSGEGMAAKLASMAQHATAVRVAVVLSLLGCFSALVLAVTALGAFVLQGSPLVAATFFAVGSTLFSWLLLRGRMIPVALAWLGVVASILLVVALPLQLAGLLHGAVTQLMWLP